MNCDRDEFDWCPTHDVPFIWLADGMVCASSLGQTSDVLTDQTKVAMYVALKDQRWVCNHEHHGNDDCDHDECHDDCMSEDTADQMVEDAKSLMVDYEKVDDLLDLIEQGRLTQTDIAMWRKVVNPHYDWQPNRIPYPTPTR